MSSEFIKTGAEIRKVMYEDYAPNSYQRIIKAEKEQWVSLSWLREQIQKEREGKTMNEEKQYYKIKIEIVLLDAGMYDDEIYVFVNNNATEIKKDFESRFRKYELGEWHTYSRPNPEFKIEELRAWWFKKKYPELFKDVK